MLFLCKLVVTKQVVCVGKILLCKYLGLGHTVSVHKECCYIQLGKGLSAAPSELMNLKLHFYFFFCGIFLCVVEAFQ